MCHIPEFQKIIDSLGFLLSRGTPRSLSIPSSAGHQHWETVYLSQSIYFRQNFAIPMYNKRKIWCKFCSCWFSMLLPGFLSQSANWVSWKRQRRWITTKSCCKRNHEPNCFTIRCFISIQGTCHTMVKDLSWSCSDMLLLVVVFFWTRTGYYYNLCSQIEVPEHSNCRLVSYWREFLEVSGSQTWSYTAFANT